MEAKLLNPAQQGVKPNSQLALNLICSLLILLWVYTALSKLSDVQEFKNQLMYQSFGKELAMILLWAIPIAELLAAGLLLISSTRLLGLWLSSLLMAAFTIYIIMVLSGYYHQIPCSCGGVLKQLGWKSHLFFNLFFLTISSIGTYGQTKLHLQKIKSHPPNNPVKLTSRK